MITSTPPADWYPDPSGRHQYRYWDGAQWTDWAANNGAQIVDPLRPAAATNRGSAEVRHHAGGRAYQLRGADGYAGIEVAGEFARMDAIHRVLGRKPKRDEQIVVEDLVAELRPEPSNRYDPNAVMVVIHGQHVGYLQKENAAVYQPVLLRVTRAGFVPTTRARIWANARADWDNPRKTFYGANVRLALEQPSLLVPANDPPASPYSILPWGNGLQVTGEEHHQNVLQPFLAQSADCVVVGTLVIKDVESSRSTKRVVEVQVDGQRIGQLTPASSNHFIPAIEHLTRNGLVTAAWLKVKGSAISAQATLQSAKAHELPAEWLSVAHVVPRLGVAVTQ